jgi:hypothetical protein
MAYLFEWDPRKAATNLRKHGVSFEEATTVFSDPQAMLRSDPDHSVEELRYILLGLSTRQRHFIVALRRPKTRLVSARRATSRERKQYEED